MEPKAQDRASMQTRYGTITSQCFRHVTHGAPARAAIRRAPRRRTAGGPRRLFVRNLISWILRSLRPETKRQSSGGQRPVCRQFACYGAVVYGNAVLSRQSGAIQNVFQIRLVVDQFG